MEVLCIRHFGADLHKTHHRLGISSLLGRHKLMLLPGPSPLGHEFLGLAMGSLFGRDVLAVVDDFGDLVSVGVV